MELRKIMLNILLVALFSLSLMTAGCDVVVEIEEEADAGALVTFYRDVDGDGFGDSAVTVEASTQPTGYINNSLDCDDTNAAINPDATEVADDSVDSNCDGEDNT